MRRFRLVSASLVVFVGAVGPARADTLYVDLSGMTPGGQALFCRGLWPGLEGAALVRRSVFL
jgi:hypothetical protein